MDSTHNTTEPPLKRKRVDVAVSPQTNSVPAERGPVHDEKFYLEKQGADCVICAGDVLFKVHRFVLAKDSSVFQDMFGATEEGGHTNSRIGSVAEGSSDNDPIILPESPEDIRALLWVLYALPKELQLQQSAGGDLGRLLIIARMTHKYQFTTTEAWALDAVSTMIPIFPKFWKNSSGPISVLEVAIICNCEALQDLILDHWVPKILSRNLLPISALLTGEKYQIKRLQGAAYYGLLFSGTGRDVLSPLKIPPELNKDQRARLISGYWRIAELKAVEPELASLPGSGACFGHDTSCVVAWRSQWERYVDPKLDFLGRLVYIHKNLAMDQTRESIGSNKGGSGNIMGMAAGCRQAALSKLQLIIDQYTKGLFTYFEDLTMPSA